MVTARKRAETLLDVPIAATAISGDTLTARGINSVREAAALAPGLSINSDGTGRAFVAIRGVGVTLVQSVQPGVGLFIDGIYQPNTSYLNNPLTDVERIEVLRGPQGTLYGKNTLGGAINVITRQPGNDFEVRGNASYAGPDDSWGASAAISAPIVTDVLSVRIAAAHRQQDGFLRNVTIGGDANAFNTDSVNATIRLTPQPGFSLTVKGYYDWVDGANTPYARVTGPQNYSRDIQFNTLNRTQYRYRGVNARAEADVGGGSRLALIGAYDMRDSTTLDGEGDFGPANIVRSSGSDQLRTQTIELRLNSDWSNQFSSLFGCSIPTKGSDRPASPAWCRWHRQHRPEFHRRRHQRRFRHRLLEAGHGLGSQRRLALRQGGPVGARVHQRRRRCPRQDHVERVAAARVGHPPLDGRDHDLCLGRARLSRRRLQRGHRTDPHLSRRFGLDL